MKDLVVHEHETCGGSDHRPLTFSVPDNPPTAKLVDRWNICRLTKPEVEKKYAESLAKEMAEETVVEECRELEHKMQEEGVSGARLQAQVDDLWNRITGCIHRAARQTVGRLRFQSHTPKDFWTAALEAEHAELVPARMEAQDAQLE